MGELSESIEDDAGAGQSFSRAAEYFKEDGNSEASATKCLLKVADYAAMDKRYAKAVEIYEEVGASGLCGALSVGDSQISFWLVRASLYPFETVV